MTTQPKALRLADELCEPVPGYPKPTSLEKAAGNELRRLHLQHKLALQDWLDKTDWVQETVQAGEPGMHRADVLKKRIEKLEASNQELLAALKLARSIIGHPDDAHTRMISDAIAKAERTTT